MSMSLSIKPCQCLCPSDGVQATQMFAVRVIYITVKDLIESYSSRRTSAPSEFISYIKPISILRLKVLAPNCLIITYAQRKRSVHLMTAHVHTMLCIHTHHMTGEPCEDLTSQPRSGTMKKSSSSSGSSTRGFLLWRAPLVL